MAITDFEVNFLGQAGETPRLFYLSTDNTVAEILVTGFMDSMVNSNIPIGVGDMGLVRTYPTPQSDPAVAWYTVILVSGHYTLSPANSPFPTVTVPNGGTGLTTLTPYAIMTGGSTATGPMLQVVGVGAIGEVLTSAGAGALPVWGTAGGAGAPASLTYVTNLDETADLPNSQSLELLATGLVKNTTATGILSIGVQGTDYYAPGGVDVAVTDGGTGASTAAGARTNLGLVIGTDVQAYNATLQSISGLGTAADKMIYTTGINTWAESAITAFGRSLIDDANAAAARTTLGLGTIAVQDASAVTITGGSITGITDLLVADGGTGVSSFTAYALIAGGVTSGAALQSVSGVGTSGQVLTSGGAGMLPTWEDATAGGTVTSVSGTVNRITSTGGTDPIIDISASYVGQASITTLGTIGTGVWQGTVVGLSYGGTSKALTASDGGIVYTDADSMEVLSGTATAGQVLRSGSSAAPSWSTATYPATATGTGTLLRADGTNWVATTATYPATTTVSQLLYSSSSNVVAGLATANNGVLVTSGAGVPSISSTLPSAVQGNITTVGTITSGAWNGSVIPLAYGGTSASLAADNGGIFYSNATTGAILAGTATAGRMLRSGASAAPTWSTATFPATATGTGTFLRADGTNWLASTATLADTYAVSTLLYASSSNVVSGLATTNRAALSTNSTGVPTWLALTDGQIVIGSTAGSPAAGSITAGAGITVTPGSNSITITNTTMGTVTSVSGTASRITSTGGATPVIDISAAYVGQASITTLGTISTGVWDGTDIVVSAGGTGNSTFTAYSVICAGTTATGAFQNVVGLGAAGTVLTSGGAGTLPTWSAAGTGTVTSVSGTAARITSTGGATPVIDIDAAYVGQASLTTLGTITTGVWNGTDVAVTAGGTGVSTMTTAYAPVCAGTVATGALQVASTDMSNVGYVLTSTGSGSLPTWQAVGAGTVTSVSGTAARITSTGGATPVIDIDATYVGQASITTLGTIGTGIWQGTLVGLAYGGTNKNMTPSNGGIVWTDADSMEVLAGTATAGQMLRSGATAAPTWSTATFPATATGTGTILRADGTNWVATTATYPATTTVNQLLYSSATNVVSGLATGNDSVLITNGSGVPSISATLPAVVQGNIVTVGTVTTGVWNGTAVTVPYGGTGASSFTAYAPVIGGTTSTNPLASAATGMSTSGYVLTSNGDSAAPTWQEAPGASGGEGSAKYWGVIYTGPGAYILDSFNISSNTYISTGKVYITLTTAFSSDYFAALGCGRDSQVPLVTQPSVGFTNRVYYNSYYSGGVNVKNMYISVAGFGDQ